MDDRPRSWPRGCSPTGTGTYRRGSCRRRRRAPRPPRRPHRPLGPERLANPHAVREAVAQAHVPARGVALPELDLVRDEVVQRPVVRDEVGLVLEPAARRVGGGLQVGRVVEHLALASGERLDPRVDGPREEVAGGGLGPGVEYSPAQAYLPALLTPVEGRGAPGRGGDLPSLPAVA